MALQQHDIGPMWNTSSMYTWDGRHLHVPNNPHLQQQIDMRNWRVQNGDIKNLKPGQQISFQGEIDIDRQCPPYERNCQMQIRSPILFVLTLTALVGSPLVSPNGRDLRVEWQSESSQANIYGYQVEFRPATSTRWEPYGNVIPHEGHGRRYATTISNLRVGETYHVRIQVLDRTHNAIFTSPEAVAATSCSQPTSPPLNIRVDAPDPSHVRIMWQMPPPEAWNCADAKVELQVVEPSRARTTEPLIFEAHQTEHVMDSRPSEQWQVRMRLVNNGGKSQWSSSAVGATSTQNELVINVRIDVEHQSAARITWQSFGSPSIGDLVSYYLVEISDDGRQWREHHGGRVPFSGIHVPYSFLLSELQPGQSAYVRIKAMDYNNGDAYITPPHMVNLPNKCQAPSAPPADLRAQGTAPTQIRVTWTPLAQTDRGCDRVWYVLKYSSSNTEGYRNFTEREMMAVFDSQAATRWSFSIQAANEAGSSHWSQVVTGVTLEGAPSTVRDLRFYQLGAKSVQISWQPPEQPNGVINGYELTYQLLSKGRCTDSVEGRQVVNIDGEQTTQYQLDGIAPHSKYIVTVAARTSTVGPPARLEITTESGIPAAPPRAIIADSREPTSVDIQWQAPACLDTNGEITEYEYEVNGVDSWVASYNTRASVRENRVTVTPLTPFSKYNVRVRAYTSKGPGPWSVPQIVSTKSAENPSAPQKIHIIDTTATSVTIMWFAPFPPGGDIDQYKVRWTQTGLQTWSERNWVLNQAACPPSARVQSPQAGEQYCATIEALESDQSYDIQVSAHTRGSQAYGAWSHPESARTGSGPVQILSIDKEGGGGDSLNVKWNVRPADAGRVTEYRIVAYPVNAPGRSRTYTVAGKQNEYRIEELEENTEYNVTVQARTSTGQYGQGAHRRHRRQYPYGERIPGMPRAPRVINSEPTNLDIEFEAPHDQRSILEYEIEYRVSNGQSWATGPRVRNTGERMYRQRVEGLNPNSNIDIRVKAIGNHNRLGDPSPHTTARTTCAAPRSPPAGMRIESPGPSEVKITWARPQQTTWNCDDIEYELSYRSPGQHERTVKIRAEQTEYTLPTDAHTTIYVKLRTTNKMGASQWTEEQQVTTKQDKPGKVRNLLLDPRGPNTVMVSWLDPAEKRGEITGYDVAYRVKFRVACPEDEPQDVTSKFITVYNVKENDYLLTGLLPNTEYEVEVKARTTMEGPGMRTSVRTGVTPPSAAPLDLKLTYKMERALSFAWQEVDCSQRHGQINTYEYELLGLDNWAKLERQIANISETQVTIDGLTPYTKYMVRVKAYNSAGGGPNTENLEVQTAKAEAPLPPQDLVVLQEGTDFFAVSWVPPYPPYGPLESYKLRYKLVTFDGREDWREFEFHKTDPRLRCLSDQPSYRVCYNVTGLGPGQQFRVQTAAKIEGGTYGEWCSAVIANTLEILPGAPRSIYVVAKTSDSLRIKWEGPAEMAERVTSYHLGIQPCDSSGDQVKQYTVDGNTYEYEFIGLEPEKCYNVSVAAGTSRGLGPPASTKLTTDHFVIPVLETRPSVVPLGPHSLSVEWPAVNDPTNKVAGYIVEYDSLHGQGWLVSGDMVEHYSVKQRYNHKINGLQPNTMYQVRIRVVDHNRRQGEPSEIASARTGCGKPESPPDNVQATAPSPGQEVRITWTPPPQSSWQCGDIAYELSYRNSSGGRDNQIAVDGAQTEKRFPASPFETWYVKMRTTNVAGHSEWTPEVSVQTPQAQPSEPFNVNARPTGPNTATITWTAPRLPNGEIDGYAVVYVPVSDGPCGAKLAGEAASTQVKTVRGETAELTGLQPGTRYMVRVRAKNGYPEQSIPSEPIEFVTHDATPTAPTGPPENVVLADTKRDQLTFNYAPPPCEKANGEITQYEYRLRGVDTWVENFETTSISSRTRVTVNDLEDGTRYAFQVRAYTKAGPGPWSDPVEARTAGSEIGSPIELTVDSVGITYAKLHWMPPSPLRSGVTGYRLQYSSKQEDANPTTVDLSGIDLTCHEPNVPPTRRCYKLGSLQPMTSYGVQVQARADSGNWGDWSTKVYFTTSEDNGANLNGSLYLITNTDSAIKVGWIPPDFVDADIDQFVVEIENARNSKGPLQTHELPKNEREFEFAGLKPVTAYNVTIKGISNKKDSPYNVWVATQMFSTTDSVRGPLHWLLAPTNLHLIEKNQTMMHVQWDPPEIPEFQRKLMTHYRVTIAPLDPRTGNYGELREFTVPKPTRKIRWEDLSPETVYRITVQGCTANGCGLDLWGAYSTLPYGVRHILRLKYRTPTSLRVQWTQDWGRNTPYTLTAVPLWSKTTEGMNYRPEMLYVPSDTSEWTFPGLVPDTIYNVTLTPDIATTGGGAWGAYNTLPPGHLLVQNLRVCNHTDYALSFSWDPLDGETVDVIGTHYKVRYTKNKPFIDTEIEWVEDEPKTRAELMCPKDPCHRLCYLIYNLDKPIDFTVQVAAKVNGTWNNWKTVTRDPQVYVDKTVQTNCCIVPPNYYLDTINDPGTIRTIIIKPVPNDTHVQRYYVIVDERSDRGDIDYEKLTDRLTAQVNGIPYYVAGSFNNKTLMREMNFPVGDAKVYGGYLNYPLEKDKDYTFPFLTHWIVDDKPVIGWWRDTRGLVVAGWPWWWLLLLLLLLLLLILCYCCLFWCLASRYRKRASRRVIVNGSTTTPLLGTMEGNAMSHDLKALESRIDNIRSQVDKGKGDFEDGYVRGFRDASKVGSAGAARKRLDEDYGGFGKDWHAGFVQGLRDAGMSGMSTSMKNLAGQEKSGYSAGYTQGFRDGNSGIFGDRITTTLLNRLEEQYPTQDEFRRGYVDGFKEGASSRLVHSEKSDSRLQENLEHISERLQTLERQKGDEIHSTKIYHVYNQAPDVPAQAAALASELDESRRSTLRRHHYTAGDYMRYGYASSDVDGSSLRRQKRSLSATALAREEQPLAAPRRGTGTSNTLRSNYDTYSSRRYQYRSRSDLGAPPPVRRYASQTLLDGARPGPVTPGGTWRRDALESLQRELDTLTRSPVGANSTTERRYQASRGYSSDTGYIDSAMHTQRQATTSSSQHQQNFVTAGGEYSFDSSHNWSAARQPRILSPLRVLSPPPPLAPPRASSYTRQHQLSHLRTRGQQQQAAQGSGQSTHHHSRTGEWTDELMDIVVEPMADTLGRMKKYSTSLSQVAQLPGEIPDAENIDDASKHTVQQSYSRSYKQEYSSGGQ